MTEQEIMDLEGRELDKAVAELKGWSHFYTVEGRGLFGRYPPPRLSCPNDTKCVPEFSTDISAAWPLLEELHTKPYSVEVFLVHECENEIKYIVNVLLMHEFTEDLMADRSMISVFGDTAPEAICRAYLLWKESQND